MFEDLIKSAGENGVNLVDVGIAYSEGLGIYGFANDVGSPEGLKKMKAFAEEKARRVAKNGTSKMMEISEVTSRLLDLADMDVERFKELHGVYFDNFNQYGDVFGERGYLGLITISKNGDGSVLADHKAKEKAMREGQEFAFRRTKEYLKAKNLL